MKRYIIPIFLMALVYGCSSKASDGVTVTPIITEAVIEETEDYTEITEIEETEIIVEETTTASRKIGEQYYRDYLFNAGIKAVDGESWTYDLLKLTYDSIQNDYNRFGIDADDVTNILIDLPVEYYSYEEIMYGPDITNLERFISLMYDIDGEKVYTETISDIRRSLYDSSVSETLSNREIISKYIALKANDLGNIEEYSDELSFNSSTQDYKYDEEGNFILTSDNFNFWIDSEMMGSVYIENVLITYIDVADGISAKMFDSDERLYFVPSENIDVSAINVGDYYNIYADAFELQDYPPVFILNFIYPMQ